MPQKPAPLSLALAGKEAVEQAIVTIYGVADTQDVDLTPIDRAVDLIRGALAIRLTDCDRCGETVLFEHAVMMPRVPAGDERHLCRACFQRSEPCD